MPTEIRQALDTVLNYIPDDVKGSISAIYDMNGINSRTKDFTADKLADAVPVLDDASEGIRISDTAGEKVDLTWDSVQDIIADDIQKGTFVEETVTEQAKEELIKEERKKTSFDVEEYARSTEERFDNLVNIPFTEFPLAQDTEPDSYYTIRSASVSRTDADNKPFEDSENAKNEIKLQIKYAAYKKDSLNSEGALKGISSISVHGTDKINALLEKLEERKMTELSERGMAVEPVITINWSEHDNPLMGDSVRLSLAEADTLFQMLDSVTRDERSEEDYQGAWYYKTSFDITYAFDNDIKHYDGRQDFGDGHGSLLEHIETVADDYINFYQEHGEMEGAAESLQEWQNIKEQFVPYLQSHMIVSKIEANSKELLKNLPENEADGTREELAGWLDWVDTARRDLNSGIMPEIPEFTFQATKEQEDSLDIESTYPQIREIVEEKEHSTKTQERIEIEFDNENERDSQKISKDDSTPDVDENVSFLEQVLADVKTEEKASDNFKITEEHLGEGTPKEKFKQNMEAIQTLKLLEETDMNASKEQKQILSRYVGWGGLSDAFDERKDNWKAERDQLKALLTEEEYNAARASTLDSFYTAPVIIDSIYEKLADMGLSEGKMLEPSCAVGNFIGKIPDSMNLEVTGVELDSISGRIAQKLYPDADIQIKGFEKTNFSNGTFDVAVGNVPFGNIKPYDKEYNKDKLLIHDYFFNKTLDKVKAGGIVAFITSSGTLDKRDSRARRLISEKADFLGAVRLPNTAFKKNAGTEVTSDIIFLQKKAEPDKNIDENFVNISRSESGIEMNQYFIDHPEQICGKMEMVSGQFGFTSTCQPDESRPLEDQIRSALKNIDGKFSTIVTDLLEDDFAEREADTIISPEAENFSYIVNDGKIYFKEDSDICTLVTDKNEKPLSGKVADRIKGLVELRDKTHHLLNIQSVPRTSDEEIKEAQAELKDAYKRFSKANGRINDKGNRDAFRNDDSYYLLTSLEVMDDDNKFERLADIFTKRTVQPVHEVEAAETPHDALIVSMNRYAEVDISYIAALCGQSEDKVIEKLTQEKEIFLNPENHHYETADEYLSGNVRHKLEIAEQAAQKEESLFRGNVEQLRAVQPPMLNATDISVRLGSTWIGTDVIKDFIHDELKVSSSLLNGIWRKPDIQVHYDERTSEWNITGKHKVNNPQVDTIYGTEKKNALDILQASLNLKTVRVMAKDSDGNFYVDKEETEKALTRQQQLKEAFKNWVFSDPERRESLVDIYNQKFNSIRPREYDGSNLSFDSMNPTIRLNDHQKDAVARQVFGGNTLLAHCVGAGKTFTMAAAGMEMKRIGVCKKPLYVVPKALVGQWAKEFATLYPTAKVLAAGEKDFSPANRKKFTAKIATGNYDAIIISHSQFEKIPLSNDYMAECLQKEIDETMAFIEMSKSEKKQDFSVKQAEKTLKSLRIRLEGLTDIAQDNVITFENLGIDHLFVDESHTFKNLPFTTKLNNVAGINNNNTKRCMDMLFKTQYINEITGNKGVTFATGTPISNTMTELYANMKYLQPDVLESIGCSQFDQWAANFGNTVTAMEFDVTGQRFQQKTRFAEFFNLPELMSCFKEAADIRTPDMLNLPTPDYEIKIVDVEASDIQKSFLEDIVNRCERVRSRLVEPTEDNMLSITTDGRLLAFDQRMLDPTLPEDPNCKINVCVNNAFEIYKQGEEEKVTQIIFSDLGVPDGSKAKEKFDAYHEIKNKLLEKGVPEKEIAIIHDYDTNAKKAQLQAKMRAGEVRFLIGSTQRCGIGFNVQTKLKALHHLDVPWKPSDIDQREGRIIRQGNQNKNVDIFRYVTKNTFDTYSWQIIEQKQRFVSQIMTSKSPVRSMQDVDDSVLEAATAKAIASGNMRVLDKANLEKEVSQLKLEKASHLNMIYALQDQVRHTLPQKIQETQKHFQNQLADARTLRGNDFDSSDKDAFCMKVDGTEYQDKKEAGAALIDFAKKHGAERQNGIPCGEYKGFPIKVSYEFMSRTYNVCLQGKENHSVVLSDDPNGMITRMDNALSRIASEIIPRLEGQVEDLNKQLATATEESQKVFPKEELLCSKEAELAEINQELEEALSEIPEETAVEEVQQDNLHENSQETQDVNEPDVIQKEESSQPVTQEQKEEIPVADEEAKATLPIANGFQPMEFKNFVISEDEDGSFRMTADRKDDDTGKFSNLILCVGKTKEELQSWAKEKKIDLKDQSETITGRINHHQNIIKKRDRGMAI
ncbi:MAG: SNF2-related protein [Ruminococcus flavefaciens]|nr:SNF2-related protein [Ruminococcus flavefaciens]